MGAVLIILVLGWTSCDAFFEFDPTDVVSEDTQNGDENNDDNGGGSSGGGDDGNGDGGGGIEVEPSEEDPEVSSCECRRIDVSTDPLLILPTEIPDELPENYDLSELMPPVRSQGQQGSCVSWATSYYLKSYQEKIQNEYEYETFGDVMSPSFVYNQVKPAGDCLTGSNIRLSLQLLQEQGVSSWEEFPYFDTECSDIPTQDIFELALENRIGEFYALGIPEDNTDEDYTLINLYKTLLSQDNPIVMSMVFTNLLFEFQDDDYVAYGYQNDNPDDPLTCHAILLVGYDDEKEAFKFVNSWGSFWGNEGYGWLSYDFFRPLDDDMWIDGYSGESYVVYDID